MIKCKQCCFTLEIFLFEFVLFKSLQSTSLNIRVLITSNGMNLALINVRICGLKQGQQFGFRYYYLELFFAIFRPVFIGTICSKCDIMSSLKIFRGFFPLWSKLYKFLCNPNCPFLLLLQINSHIMLICPVKTQSILNLIDVFSPNFIICQDFNV